MGSRVPDWFSFPRPYAHAIVCVLLLCGCSAPSGFSLFTFSATGEKVATGTQTDTEPSTPPLYTSLLAGVAVLAIVGFLLARWWISTIEPVVVPPMQLLTVSEKLDVVESLSASSFTTATAKEKTDVLKVLQQTRTTQASDAESDQERSDVLRALSGSH